MTKFKELYNNLIIDKTNLLILDYEYQNGLKYSYSFKHHVLDNDVTTQLANLLIDSIIFYAYSANEIETQGLIDGNLRTSAAYALSERLAKRHDFKRDGLVGELMLDILIQVMNPNAQKLFTRAKYTRFKDNNEITGYDAAFFVKNGNNTIELWLGQSKAGEMKYCKDGICKDLNDKFLDSYFSDVIRYLRDRAFEETTDKDLIYLLHQINQVIFQSFNLSLTDIERKQFVTNEIFKVLNTNCVTVKVPCLLMFDSEIYNDQILFKEKLQNLSKGILDYFEEKDFNYTKKINIEAIFIILPTYQLNKIKEIIVNLKKENQ